MGQLSTLDYELEYEDDVLPVAAGVNWDAAALELSGSEWADPADILMR